ncbi:MAG: cyclopropane-fatty-acyl-phospholipid synthase family protein [Mariniblastus sp.]
MIARLIDFTERGLVPDALVRAGIRRLLKKRLAKVDLGDDAANETQLRELVAEFSQGPIALVPEKANEQHYEVPAKLFELTLGPRRKYSSCFFAEGVTDLATAEEDALRQTCERARIVDGMKVLELGCGWGSLSLWMAEQYPNCELTVVSNSNSQREFIEARSRELGIDKNLTVVTSDINDFDTDIKFDRAVSVEMFEHVRNHRLLMNRISNWLCPDGKLFVHIFCHRKFTYRFQDEGNDDWMSRYFFSGGVMPGDGLLPSYDDDLTCEKKWCWNGKHYQATCEAWLKNMDANRSEIMPILESTYGQSDAVRWFNRWRMFYLSCSELFGFSQGNEWWVSHYLFEKNKS